MKFWLKVLFGFAIWLRKYAVALLLIFGFIFSMLSLYTQGAGPVPQQPPRGYEVLRKTVSLQWNLGTREGPVHLQISIDDPSFTEMDIDKVVGNKSHTIRELKPGTTYYWRLMQNDETSPVAHFKVSPNNAAY